MQIDMRVLIFFLSCIGITTIITQSKLFEFVRSRTSGWFRELIHCSLCTGFWVGCALSVLGYGISNPFLDGVMSSPICYLYYVIVRKLCPEC